MLQIYCFKFKYIPVISVNGSTNVVRHPCITFVNSPKIDGICFFK